MRKFFYTLVIMLLFGITNVYAKPVLKIESVINDDNTVTIFAKDENKKVKLKDTKSSWILSEDGLTYSKTFTKNQTFSTIFEFEDGTKVFKEINVLVPVPEFDIEYVYASGKTTIIVKDISGNNIKLKATKPSWTLSADELTYSKTFTKDQKVSTTFEFIDGTKVYKEINVSIHKPNLDIEYVYDSGKTTVIVKEISGNNIKLKDTKSSWILSDDELTYSKTFTKDQKVSTIFEFIDGTKVYKEINVSIHKPKFGIEYIKEKKLTKVIVKDISGYNYKLKETKPSWELSEDSLTYSKTFNKDQKVSTTFEFIDGTKVYKELNITIVKPKLEIEYLYNNDNTVTVVASDKSGYNFEFKNTKSNWNLSNDNLIYSKTYSKDQSLNTIFEFEDGTKKQVTINAVMPFNVNINYEYDIYSGKVKITANSNRKFISTDNSDWQLSEDGYTYTKVEDGGKSYNVNFTSEINQVVTKEINTPNYIYVNRYGLSKNVRIGEYQHILKKGIDGGTWTSDDENIGIVDQNGKVKFLKEGSVRITYTDKFDYKYSINYTVYYTILGTKEINKTIYDQNGIKVVANYLNYNLYGRSSIYFTVTNNTDKAISISAITDKYIENTFSKYKAVINGVYFSGNNDISAVIANNILPGDTEGSYIYIEQKALRYYQMQEINSISFKMNILDPNTYKTIFLTDLITIEIDNS